MRHSRYSDLDRAAICGATDTGGAQGAPCARCAEILRTDAEFLRAVRREARRERHRRSVVAVRKAGRPSVWRGARRASRDVRRGH